MGCGITEVGLCLWRVARLGMFTHWVVKVTTSVSLPQQSRQTGNRGGGSAAGG